MWMIGCWVCIGCTVVREKCKSPSRGWPRSPYLTQTITELHQPRTAVPKQGPLCLATKSAVQPRRRSTDRCLLASLAWMRICRIAELDDKADDGFIAPLNRFNAPLNALTPSLAGSKQYISACPIRTGAPVRFPWTLCSAAMALVTLQRSPTPSAASSASTNAGEVSGGWPAEEMPGMHV